MAGHPLGTLCAAENFLARLIKGIRFTPKFEHTSFRKKREFQVITCYLRYVIDPDKLDDFEIYAKKWMPLVNKFGGKHHGYFLPHEGANNIAFALFSFPSLAAYEEYRTKAATDPECQEAMAHHRNTKCFDSYERSFMRPVFD